MNRQKDLIMEQVDMEIDGESEYEEEEYLVYIDIEPTSMAESQIRQSKNIKIYGIDEKKPLLQINNQFFEGKCLNNYIRLLDQLN